MGPERRAGQPPVPPPHTQTEWEYPRRRVQVEGPHDPANPHCPCPSRCLRAPHSLSLWRKVHFGKVGIPHFNSDYSLIQHIDHLAWCLCAECMNVLMELGYHERVWPTVQTRHSICFLEELSRWQENRKPGHNNSGRGHLCIDKISPSFY